MKKIIVFFFLFFSFSGFSKNINYDNTYPFFFQSFQIGNTKIGYMPPWTKWGVGYESVVLEHGVFQNYFHGHRAATGWDCMSIYVAGFYLCDGDYDYTTEYNVLSYPVKISSGCSRWGISLGEFVFPLPKPIYFGRIGFTVVHSYFSSGIYDTSHNKIGWAETFGHNDVYKFVGPGLFDREYSGISSFSENAEGWGIKVDISLGFISLTLEKTNINTSIGVLVGF